MFNLSINKKMIISFMFLMIASYTYADVTSTLNKFGSGDIGTIFANFTKSGESLIKLIKYSAGIIGLFLIISSLHKLVLVANGKVELKVPLVTFLTGIALFSVMTSFETISTTMAMESSPGNISVSSGANNLTSSSAAAITGVFTFIRMIGFIAFVRGWMIINKTTIGKDGSIAKGLIHLFGGVAAINIQTFGGILVTTFAPGLSIPLGIF